MKKILILCRKDDRPTYDHKQAYTAALATIQTKCDYAIGEFEDLLFLYDGENLQVLLADGVTDIASFDMVFLTSWFKPGMLEDVALSVSVYLDSKQVKMVNTEALYTRSRSKLSQYVYAALNDISVTPFLFSFNPKILSAALATRWQFGYPVIMKGAQASRGDDNYFVKHQDEARNIADGVSMLSGPWLIVQSFVPNDGDYRIIVIEDRVAAVIHRQSQNDSHLNNASKGGDATLVAIEELPPEVIHQSIALAKLLRREVTGVDMIRNKNTGRYYLLEINNMPQLATGVFVAEKMKLLDEYFAK